MQEKFYKSYKSYKSFIKVISVCKLRVYGSMSRGSAACTVKDRPDIVIDHCCLLDSAWCVHTPTATTMCKTVGSCSCFLDYLVHAMLN